VSGGHAERLAGLVAVLAESGDLAPEWEGAFRTVARHRFIPDTVWVEDGDDLTPVRRADDPEAWLGLCYANDPVITQVDDGRPAGPGEVGREITSSVSRPDVVARMLAELGAEPGMSVLEVGTGTGWNAALMAERLGAGNITTIEIDRQVAEHARHSLERSGYEVTVITEDGVLGHAPRAPYERVIATVGAQRIPYAWVEQTRPGGRVLVPWGTDFHNGALVSFHVLPDGTATGRIVGNVAFMWLRDQRGRRASLKRDVTDFGQARTTVTELHPYQLLGTYDASLAIGVQVPRCKNIVQTHDEPGDYTVWFIDPWSSSWASLHHRPGADVFEVRRSGARDLWNEVEAAHRWWKVQGSPGRDRWGFTITRVGQYVWLDSRDNLVR
jgi:protein-L-isoaspartate(D-aspartate) O-methyltransferase